MEMSRKKIPPMIKPWELFVDGEATEVDLKTASEAFTKKY